MKTCHSKWVIYNSTVISLPCDLEKGPRSQELVRTDCARNLSGDNLILNKPNNNPRSTKLTIKPR